MGPLGMGEIVVLFVLALLIFGPKKLPELGKTFGKGMAEFKRASNELKTTFQREMDNIEDETKAVKSVATDVSRDINTSYYDDHEDDYYDGYDYGASSSAASAASSAAGSSEGAAAQADGAGSGTEPRKREGQDSDAEGAGTAAGAADSADSAQVSGLPEGEEKSATQSA